MPDDSAPFSGACPHCGETIGLAELKRMAVGDGWARYVWVKDKAFPRPVEFSDYNPATMTRAGASS